MYFMSAVGFKPPHKGHVHMIKAAVGEAAAKGSSYKIFIGQSERGGITLDQSLEMLNIFLNDAGILSGNGNGRVDKEIWQLSTLLPILLSCLPKLFFYHPVK